MSFLKNTFAILRGTIFAQAIVLLSLPILSRFFGPTAFGTLQAFQALLTVLLITSSLRYEIAILSADEKDVPGVVRLCVRLCLLMSALAAIGVAAVLLGQPRWLDQFGAVIYLLPLSMLLAGMGQIINYIGLRTQAFGVIGQGKAAQSLVYVASALGLGYLWPTAFALTAADAFGKGALVAFSNRGSVRKLLCRRIDADEPKPGVATRFRSLPLVSMPSAIINTLGSSFTTFMMLAIFDAGQAGNYAMVERMIGAPISIIATAASQAFMSALSNRSEQRVDDWGLFRKILRTNALIGLVPLLLLIFTAPTLVPWVLGSHWTQAGLFAQILAPMLYVSFVVTPFNMTLLMRGRQAWQLGWDSARLLVIGGMWLLVGRFFHDATIAVAAYSAIATVFYLAHLMLSWLALSPSHTRAPHRR